MNMVSWDEAFLILKQWRDRRDDPEFLLSVLGVSEVQIQGEITSIAGGGTETIQEVDASIGRVYIGEAPYSVSEIDLSGAEFRYDDSRGSRLVDGDWECELEARLPDGKIIVFAEWPPIEDWFLIARTFRTLPN